VKLGLEGWPVVPGRAVEPAEMAAVRRGAGSGGGIRPPLPRPDGRQSVKKNLRAAIWQGHGHAGCGVAPGRSAFPAGITPCLERGGIGPGGIESPPPVWQAAGLGRLTWCASAAQPLDPHRHRVGTPS